MAHTKSAGAGKYGRDSQPKYLGVKKSDGQTVKSGDIIVRQRGSKFIAGKGIRKGGDDTLYAIKQGFVFFTSKRKNSFDGSKKYKSMVYIREKIKEK